MRRDGPDGEEIVDAGLRRRRLQALVAFLIGHRRTTRSAIIAALWPDLDEEAALNNLGVTLNHLLRLLEPWRNSGEPSYPVRPDGQTVQLVTGTYLTLDIDQSDQHQAAAAKAEADGTPSVALDHDWLRSRSTAAISMPICTTPVGSASIASTTAAGS